jgi:hypothetical protein
MIKKAMQPMTKSVVLINVSRSEHKLVIGELTQAPEDRPTCLLRRV